MYEYKAIITKVYDGDSVTADIDLGFGVWLHKQKFRLYGINTPELRTKDPEEKAKAYAARDRLREIVLDKPVRIVSHGKGKYGRWLVEIFTDSSTSVNSKLILEGHAEHYII
jgi:micrococcal nuclease